MGESQDIQIRFVGRDSGDLLALIESLDVELEQRYGMPMTVGVPVVEDSLFAVAYATDEAVGCAALLPLEPRIGELKRMFVIPSARHAGVARRLLAAIEGEAVARGYRAIRLETGVRQPEALALYASAGYRRIPPFGEHEGGGLSVCLEKRLDGELSNPRAEQTQVS